MSKQITKNQQKLIRRFSGRKYIPPKLNGKRNQRVYKSFNEFLDEEKTLEQIQGDEGKDNAVKN